MNSAALSCSIGRSSSSSGGIALRRSGIWDLLCRYGVGAEPTVGSARSASRTAPTVCTFMLVPLETATAKSWRGMAPRPAPGACSVTETPPDADRVGAGFRGGKQDLLDVVGRSREAVHVAIAEGPVRRLKLEVEPIHQLPRPHGTRRIGPDKRDPQWHRRVDRLDPVLPPLPSCDGVVGF